MVTPKLRRSLTRRTEEITSRPRLSKTRTFQMGSPFAPKTGAVDGTRPFVAMACCSAGSGFGGSVLRLRIFWIEAAKQKRYTLVPGTHRSHEI